MRSTRAAQESGDPELMVLAMIRGAEQQTYSGQARQSTQLLDAAERLAASGSSPKALSWILAANAEAPCDPRRAGPEPSPSRPVAGRAKPRPDR